MHCVSSCSFAGYSYLKSELVFPGNIPINQATFFVPQKLQSSKIFHTPRTAYLSAVHLPVPTLTLSRSRASLHCLSWAVKRELLELRHSHVSDQGMNPRLFVQLFRALICEAGYLEPPRPCHFN